MLKRLVTGALIAGLAAGLLAAILHFAFIQSLILEGELYETGELTHFETAPAPAPAAAEGHDHGATAEAHDHEHGAAEGETSTLQRNALTVMFSVMIYVSYALLLFAGFGLAASIGRKIDATTGLIWGIAGFVTFQMAPAMGLAPELPGTASAALGDRQVWWWLTAIATGGGLLLLGYGRALWLVPVAVLLLAAPHVIGAPHLDFYAGSAPPELSAAYAAHVLGVGLAVWAVLGWVSGRIWARDAAQA